MKNISEHITYEEATHSEIAKSKNIANNPGYVEMMAMRAIAENVFEPLREGIGKPIKINSFFRSRELNKNIPGSSLTSQHMKGEAMDIEGLQGIKNSELFNYMKEHIVFDQLIWEYGTDQEPDWVHVSYSANHNRLEVLKSRRVKGKVLWERLS